MKRDFFKKQYIWLLLLVVAVIALFFVVFPETAMARPGGGHGYHGGGGHSGGGGGGGGGGDSGLAQLFIYCLINYPVPTLIVTAILVVIYLLTKGKESSSNVGNVSSRPTSTNIMQKAGVINRGLSAIKESDRNFSVPIFMDYASLLFTKMHLYISNDKIKEVEPFFLQPLDKWNNYDISEVVIGSADISEVSYSTDQQSSRRMAKIVVCFKANYTARAKSNGQKFRCNVVENWLFERDVNAQSPAPEGMGVLRCPCCGAPAEFTDSGECKHCGNLVSVTNNVWMVKSVVVVSTERVKTSDVITYAEEVGTNYRTIVDPTLMQQAPTFASLHQGLMFDSFGPNIAEPYFKEIYSLYSNLKWEQARHLLSDRLWQSMNYWIQFCKDYGCRNVLDDVMVHKVVPVKYDVDNYYESLTVRIFASCYDYYADNAGKLIAGNKSRPRSFSEYWTFVSRRGADLSAKNLSVCPSCGAPVDHMGQSGVCGYCGSKITDGNFSWVLFSITQDEEYEG